MIQVLPSPSLSTIIKYTKNFSLAADGTEYNKEKFDLLSSGAWMYCDSSAPKMLGAVGGSRYTGITKT